MFVPVVDGAKQPLLPTTPARARRWIKSGKATPFWKGGVFCVRLNQKPSGLQTQLITVGIDPGSKKEALVGKCERFGAFVQRLAVLPVGIEREVVFLPRQGHAGRHQLHLRIH